MSKQYFAKWLPVEGEIKEGDHYFDPQDTAQVWKVYPEGTYLQDPYFIERWSKCKKVKLFLCSKSIKVDDKFFLQGDPTEYECTHKKDGFLYWGGAVRYKESDCFKVIGEISPDAYCFITEHAEPTNYEFKKACYILTEFGYIIDEWDEKEEWEPKNGYIKCLLIKGPCGHFH